MKISDKLVKEIAECLLPNILAYLKTDEAERGFREWKAKREAADNNSKTG